MNIENVQFALQAISVIGVPILTGLITWITSSLKKTNKRIDMLKDDITQQRIKDTQKMADLSGNIKTMGAQLNHLNETNRPRMPLHHSSHGSPVTLPATTCMTTLRQNMKSSGGASLLSKS